MGFEDWFSCGCPTSSTGEAVLEKDYAKSITPLYKAIENHQWASVNYFIKTGYWKNNFFPDSVRPEIQARTWMVRYEVVPPQEEEEPANKTTICLPKKRQDRITWKQLPIHAAIIYNAPAIIIQKLMKIYPTALRCSDNKGNLPIHLAFRHGSNDAVLALLLQEYPEGINSREANGLLPTECATETPSPQPLRGALLKTAMSKEMDRKYIEEKVREERFYFDDRPTTPHQGNLSSRNKKQQEEKEQFDLLNQQIEILRTSVDRVISKQAPNTTPAHSGLQEAGRPFPSIVTGDGSLPRQDSKTQLSPTALESLQEMVTRTLAGPTAVQQLSPREEQGIADPPLNVITDPNATAAEQGISMVQSLMDSPSHQALPLQPTSTSNILNPIAPPPQQSQLQSEPHPAEATPAGGCSIPPILRNLSYNSMQNQHKQHQQQLQQLQEQQHAANQALRQTATFEEQQRRLDREVRLMEDKMLQMECAMKEMRNREKTVRRELALTLKEVKHWKAQAKRAATEEEKNRILTEMLHELVPSSATPRVTPRKHNKTPTANARSSSEVSGRPQQGKTKPAEQERQERQESPYQPVSMRKTQSEVQAQRRSRRTPEDERKKHQSRHYQDDRRDDEMAVYRDYPQKSNRHSDGGAYYPVVMDNRHYEHPSNEMDQDRRYADAAPAIPLRRIHSEHYNRQARSSEMLEGDQIFDTPEYPHNINGATRHKSERIASRGGARKMDPNASFQVERSYGAGGVCKSSRRFADPQGTHVESNSHVPSAPGGRGDQSEEEESNTEEFSMSLVDKIAALQAKQKNEKYKTRNYRRAERMVQQRRRDAQEHGVWQPRDPEEVARSSPRNRHAAYHRHAKKSTKQRRAVDSSPSGTSKSGGSSDTGITEYYIIDE